MQNAYGDQCLWRTRCYDRFKRFKDGRKSVDDDDPRLERPSTSTDGAHVTKVSATVRSNRRLTVREIAEDRNISIGSRHEIQVEKLEMHRVAAKFVPRSMSHDQKDNRVTACRELLGRANDDETFMMRQKSRSSQWVSKFSRISVILKIAKHARLVYVKWLKPLTLFSTRYRFPSDVRWCVSYELPLRWRVCKCVHTRIRRYPNRIVIHASNCFHVFIVVKIFVSESKHE